MKALISLWRNECVKIMRQTANKVIIIIVLVLAILLSVLVTLADNALGYISYYDDEMWMEYAETALAEGDYFWYSDCIARADGFKLFKENSISFDGWKYQTFFDTYEDLLLRRSYDKLYLDGKVTMEEFYNNFFWRFEDPGVTSYEGDAEITTEDEYIGESDSSWFDSFDAEADLAETEKSIAQLEELIITGTVRTYAQGNLTQLRETLKKEKSDLAEKESLLAKGSVTAEEVKTAALTVEGTEYMISFYESVVNTSLGDEDEDWIVYAIQDIGENARKTLAGTVPVSEEEFNSEPYYASMAEVSDYAQYCRSLEKTQANAYRALKTVDYALEHGISLPEVRDDSTKGLVRSVLGMTASLVVLAMVILTANNIASEYSAGTIRLLIIRPRRRTSIILSKFLALLTVGVLLCAVTFLLVNIICVAINGVGDFFVPDLMCPGDVVEIGSVLYSLGKMLLPVVSGMLMVALAFMMAVVTRRAALAVVIPLVLNLFTSMLQFLAIYKSTAYPILKYTVLPYLDLSPYLSSPVSGYSSNYFSGGLVTMITGGFENTVARADVSAVIGVVVIAVNLAVMFGIGFAVFRRQQIKS